ncbi:MAG: hypothetical protein Q8Q54_08880, partial [Methylococcales bacterium]|nr:hypothetical protein [Methylococcales bacterium]
MKWFVIIILAILWLNLPTAGLLGTALFILYYLLKKNDQHDDAIKQPNPPRQSFTVTAGDLADLVLLRL